MNHARLLCVVMLLMLSTAYTIGVSEYDGEIKNILDVLQRSELLEPLVDTPIHQLPVRSDSATLDSFINWAMGYYHIPGAATWTCKNGQVIWQRCYGYARLHDADSIPVADTTLFMLASISKTLVATAAMQLWERGAFNLDDSINGYLPFPVRNQNHPDSAITFRMLMTHMSSIVDNWPVLLSLYVWGGDSPIPLGSFLQDYLVPGGAYYDPAANFGSWSPGNGWEYSSAAVALLGYLVEAIEDSFPIHCRDSIFNPLSMYETSWFLAGLDTNNIAIPYQWIGSYYQPYQHYGYPDYPDGQLRTSSLQLARHLVGFMQYGMIDTVRILDSTTVALMRTNQYQISPSIIMGLIWYCWNTGGRWIWMHDGMDYGARTEASFCPDENSAVIVLTNGESDNGRDAIRNALFNYAEQYGIAEYESPAVTEKGITTTIFTGPLQLPTGKTCRVFDITGRVVEPTRLQAGIYFIEVDGRIAQKVIKIE